MASLVPLVAKPETTLIVTEKLCCMTLIHSKDSTPSSHTKELPLYSQKQNSSQHVIYMSHV